MLERIYELYNGLEKRQTMLCFKGGLNEKMVGVLLGMVEKKMEIYEPSSRIRKRVFLVLTESLQNLQHHANEHEQVTLHGDGMLVVAKNSNGYSVFTGNYMNRVEVDNLRSRLDKINKMDSADLKSFYRKVLDNGSFSDKGGGGLGMIDMARKSKRKLEYAFVPVDGENTFFSLNVNVSEES